VVVGWCDRRLRDTQFLSRSLGDTFDLARGNRQATKNLGVENANSNTSGRDCTEGKFFLTGHPELPNNEHIEVSTRDLLVARIAPHHDATDSDASSPPR